MRCNSKHNPFNSRHKRYNSHAEALQGEPRVRTVERDLLREQRDLFLNEAEALTAATSASPVQESVPDIEVAPHKRKKRGRQPLDPSLPREIVRHELPPCAHDGTPLVEIGAQISEQIDIVPQQVRVMQHHRVKYACPCCDQGIKVTPAPARSIPQGAVRGIRPGLDRLRQVHGRAVAF
jgi:transposase